MSDYLKYYDLESYLFNTVQRRFKEKGYIEAFDFFCIIIWKANRAKSYIAAKLLDKRYGRAMDTSGSMSEYFEMAKDQPMS